MIEYKLRYKYRAEKHVKSNPSKGGDSKLPGARTRHKLSPAEKAKLPKGPLVKMVVDGRTGRRHFERQPR